jgi:hypothetical protein
MQKQSFSRLSIVMAANDAYKRWIIAGLLGLLLLLVLVFSLAVALFPMTTHASQGVGAVAQSPCSPFPPDGKGRPTG